jgi:Nif-specific regulatory protein
MSTNVIGAISGIALKLAESDGLRDGTAAAAADLVEMLPARFAFVIGVQEDGDLADVLAASGLGVADFRRLESRIAKSGLWKIVQLKKPMAIDDLGRDTILNFLAFGTGARMLIAVPVILRDKCFGFLAAGFPAGSEPNENRTIGILSAVAAMTAQAVRVDRALSRESQKLEEENTHLRQELKEKYDFRRLVGNSSTMRQVYDQVTQVARSNATVLLRGESGTGKELIANTIHYNSLRSKRPFVKLSCGAFAPELADREMFGHERGAFDGATSLKKGRIEAADGGTLFLDEIGGLPAATQSRLLRLIEDRAFERIGGNEGININVRLIASTAVDLEGAVADGSFDPEFFHRLSPFSVFLPPLRDRKSDILLLAEHFLEKFEPLYKKDIRRISTPAIDMLTAYHYPGNVRELENAIESAVMVCDASVIHGHHLPPTLQTAEVSGTESRMTLTSAVEAFERDLIQDALKSTRGNIAQAARMLDSTERILGYKIGKYRIDPRRFKR